MLGRDTVDVAAVELLAFLLLELGELRLFLLVQLRWDLELLRLGDLHELLIGAGVVVDQLLCELLDLRAGGLLDGHLGELDFEDSTDAGFTSPACVHLRVILGTGLSGGGRGASAGSTRFVPLGGRVVRLHAGGRRGRLLVGLTAGRIVPFLRECRLAGEHRRESGGEKCRSLHAVSSLIGCGMESYPWTPGRIPSRANVSGLNEGCAIPVKII